MQETIRDPGEGNGNPLQYCCLEGPMDRGAWWAAVHGVAESDATGVAQHARPSLWVESAAVLWEGLQCSAGSVAAGGIRADLSLPGNCCHANFLWFSNMAFWQSPTHNDNNIWFPLKTGLCLDRLNPWTILSIPLSTFCILKFSESPLHLLFLFEFKQKKEMSKDSKSSLRLL